MQRCAPVLAWGATTLGPGVRLHGWICGCEGKLSMAVGPHWTTYIPLQKRTLSGPHFPRFCECSVVAISFSILYVHIPVMVLLEIHTDCQTSSGLPKNVQRVMKVLKEKEGGKTNIVCVYIYIASLRGRGGQGKETKKNGGFSPLLALLFA